MDEEGKHQVSRLRHLPQHLRAPAKAHCSHILVLSRPRQLARQPSSDQGVSFDSGPIQSTVLAMDRQHRYHCQQNTRHFFHLFSDLITLKTYSWQDEIKATPLKGDDYFGDYARIRSDFNENLAGFSDLLHHLLLANYGGLWIDTDVVLLRDVYPATIQVTLFHCCISLPWLQVASFADGLMLYAPASTALWK